MRFGSQQVLGVSVLRVGKQRGDRAGLDDFAFGHDADAVGDGFDDAQIMGDEQHGHAQTFLQILEQGQDLRLHGDVERGGGFIGDQQIGFIGQRHGDHDALALAARELVRKSGEAAGRVGNADGIEQFECAGTGGVGAQAPMDGEHFADLGLYGVNRIERAHRFLKDHRNIIAAHGAQVVGWRGDQVLALEQDLTGQLRAGRQQLEHRQGGDRLARTGFADQREGLAGRDIKADIAGGGIVAKADGQVADRKEGGAHAKALRGSKASRTASPTNTSRVMMMAMAKKPVRPSQGACRFSLP